MLSKSDTYRVHPLTRSSVEAVKHDRPSRSSVQAEVRRMSQRLKRSSVSGVAKLPGSEWRWVINPQRAFMKRWDLVMILCLIFTGIVTPFEVAFLETEWNVLFFVNRMVDVLFVGDIIVNFFLAYLEENEQLWVTDKCSIAKRYASTWMIIDITSILPFDTVGLVTEDDALTNFKLFRNIRLLRLFKLFRIFRASRILSRWETRLSISYSWLSLIRFIVAVLSICHWMACAFGISASGELIDGKMDTISWISEYDYLDPSSPFDVYGSALYWSVMTLTTIGYGDINAVTEVERWIAILCMIIGASIYAYVIGAVCSIVSSMDEATTEYHKTMDELNLYMKESKLPKEMKLRLREYFQHCRKLIRTRHYTTLLQRMSPMLRGEVAVFCNKQWVEKVPFFRDTPADEREALLTELAMNMVPMAFAPHEPVIRIGEPTEQMYIIQRGLCSKQGRVLSSGAVFGEDVILHNAHRAYIVRSLTYTDVSALSKVVLERILATETFTKTRKIVRKAAIRLALRREFLLYAKTVKAMRMAGLQGMRKRLSSSLPDDRPRPQIPDTDILRSDCDEEEEEEEEKAVKKEEEEDGVPTHTPVHKFQHHVEPSPIASRPLERPSLARPLMQPRTTGAMIRAASARTLPSLTAHNNDAMMKKVDQLEDSVSKMVKWTLTLERHLASIEGDRKEEHRRWASKINCLIVFMVLAFIATVGVLGTFVLM